MLSPNQIYDYLRYFYLHSKKSIIVRNFKDGSINPLDLMRYRDNSASPYVKNDDTKRVWRYDPIIDMYDQEHIDITAMKNQYEKSVIELHTNGQIEKWESWAKESNTTIPIPTTDILKLSNYDFFNAISASMHIPIICHSEKNSNDIDALTTQYHFAEAHYWCHGMLSRFWYSEYELLQKMNNSNSKRFGLYVRNVNGDSSYRKTLLKGLIKNKDQTYYNVPETVFDKEIRNAWNHSKEKISSSSSAVINWPDHSEFDIQIVPETLFSNHKTHLTEKIIKPIVMYQPFIVVGCVGTLDYLRNYGFKTFSDIWDESYDRETDNNKRMSKILNLIDTICNLSPTEYKKLIKKTEHITRHNRDLFYSDKFKKQIISELHNNLNEAELIQKENFSKYPGGSLLTTLEKLDKELGYVPKNFKQIAKVNTDYLKENNISLYNLVKERFNSLC